MSRFKSKRQLRAEIQQLKSDLSAYSEDADKSVQRVRDCIRVLHLAQYIERAEGMWSEDESYYVYDVNGFLADIEAGVKHLDERAESIKMTEALGRLGLEDAIMDAVKAGEKVDW